MKLSRNFLKELLRILMPKKQFIKNSKLKTSEKVRDYRYWRALSQKRYIYLNLNLSKFKHKVNIKKFNKKLNILLIHCRFILDKFWETGCTTFNQLSIKLRGCMKLYFLKVFLRICISVRHFSNCRRRIWSASGLKNRWVFPTITSFLRYKRN